MMPLSLSNDGSAVIARVIHKPTSTASDASYGRVAQVGISERHEFYQVAETVRFLERCGSSRAALQLPDTMLRDAAFLVTELENSVQSDIQVFVLADTTFGECCVDETAALHAGADAIVHYGMSCLSPTCRIPVRLCFGCMPIDCEHCADMVCRRLSTMIGDDDLNGAVRTTTSVLVLYDLEYCHAAKALRDALESRAGRNEAVVGDSQMRFVMAHVDVERMQSDPSVCDNTDKSCTQSCSVSGFRFWLPDKDSLDDGDTILFVGREGALLTNVMLECNSNAIFTYDPRQSAPDSRLRRETSTVNRMLMRRYYLVQKAKDARIIGILVGTLGVAQYMDAVRHVKRLVRQAGKKSYTFLVGKINDPKLSNFSEVDVFVLVACPFSSMIDTSRFFKDVVTPYELELALVVGREWTGQYSADFRDVLPGQGRLATSCDTIQEPQSRDNALGVRYSLVTGKMVRATSVPTRDGSLILNSDNDSKDDDDVRKTDAGKQSLQIARRTQGGALIGDDCVMTAADVLANRSFQGLDPQFGQVPVGTIEDGLSGIAQSYESEPVQ